MKNLLVIFNWKQIFIYLLATLLLVIGVAQFSFLIDTELIGTISKEGDAAKLENLGERLSHQLIWTRVFELVGFFISGVAMYYLTRKLENFWINLLSVLMFGYLIIRFHVWAFGFIKQVLFFVGGLFSGFGVFYPYLINGIFLTSLGLLLFYNRRIKMYSIDH